MVWFPHPISITGIGDFLDKGDAFCEIVSEGTVVVEMPVPEKEIGDVSLGFPITIKVRGYPKRWYRSCNQHCARWLQSMGWNGLWLCRASCKIRMAVSKPG